MQKKYAYILLALLVLGGFSINEKNAFAATISEDLGTTDVVAGFNFPGNGQYFTTLLGTGLTDTASSTLFAVDSLGAGTENCLVHVILTEFTDSGYSSGAVQHDLRTNNFDILSGSHQYVVYTPLAFNPAKYYVLSIGFSYDATDGPTCVVTDMQSYSGDSSTGTYFPPFNKPYYNRVYHGIYTGDAPTPPPLLSPHFTSITVSTSTQKLNLQGIWNDSSSMLVQQSTENETLNLNIYPLGPGGSGFTNSTNTGAFNLDFRILQTGCVSNTSSTTICTTDKTYTYQAILYDGQYPNQEYPYKDATSTQLVYPYQGTSTIFTDSFTNQFYSGTLGTSTLVATTSLLSFLNVPQLLQQRIPFAYIFQIANGIYAGINSSSTGEIPSGNFIWRNTQNGTTTFDFFSKNTIETYLSPNIISLWRGFLLACLTVEFGYALYRMTKSHKII